jgi:hypothetical protein
MGKRKQTALLAGALAIALLLAGGVSWLTATKSPRLLPEAGQAPLPPVVRVQPEDAPKAVPATVPAPQVESAPSPEAGHIAPAQPERMDGATDDHLFPPPTPLVPRPPAEGEQGETIAPAYRHPDLSGQALQIHRDLEATWRSLHSLLR